jgi:YtcA family
VRSGRERTRLGWTVLVLVPAFVQCAACDPLVDVAGAFFPGWMVCILVAIASTTLLRHFLSRAQLEPSLGPLLIIYPSLAATIALVLWLGLYRGAP